MRTGQQLGPYTIEAELGFGAMGTVYRARDAETGKHVAIKIVSVGNETHPTAIDRFKRETKILKKLNHPHIVRLLTHGRVKNGGPFYVMEYIDGESIEKTLRRRGRFTWEEVVAVGVQLCGALQHAHEQGIIHRDLKPANIMLMPDGTAKLTDFGIAKGLELSQLTATNATVGTASYMSPEQCRGEKTLAAKSDLYSLGVVFYELLTGRLPFQADTALDMFLAHTKETFARPSRIVLDIPIWLDTLVCQLLEKEPEQRPFDAAIVARSLNEIAEKVAAQRSAGVDVVSARRVDLPRGARLRDEADREAARLLKEATTKKKIKRKKTHYYETGWFLGVSVSAVLVALAAFTYFFFIKTPSAESLYYQAKALREKGEALRARNEPIAEYLKNYGNQDNAMTAEVRSWADQIDLDQCERQLRVLVNGTRSPGDDAERTAVAAVKLEDDGDLEQARERWHKLEKHGDSQDSDLRPWRLLADKRVKEFAEAANLDGKLTEQHRGLLKPDHPITYAGSLDGRALRAKHAELFHDSALALDSWQRLKEVLGAEHGPRDWLLLANKKVHDLKDEAPRGAEAIKARRELLKDKLNEAEKLSQSNPREAALICREICALYGEDANKAVAAAVADAKKLLTRLKTP